MGQLSGDENYVLIIKEDMYSFVWFEPRVPADAIFTDNVLLKYFQTVGTVLTLVSDHETHFLNESISELRPNTKSNHHFTLQYCPFASGTVEDF